MPPPEIHQPFFFYRGRRFEAVIGNRNEYRHAFGAVGGFSVHGQPEGQRGVHQLLTLDTRDPVLASIFPGLTFLPIFYSFHYESGSMEYQITDTSSVSITELDETTYSVDRPYEGYPAEFPVHTFTLTESTECDLATFERDVWQHIDRRFAEQFIAIIPPSDAYGVNLWRQRGNFDDIHVKCFIDPVTRRAVVYNECG